MIHFHLVQKWAKLILKLEKSGKRDEGVTEVSMGGRASGHWEYSVS